MGTKRMVMGTSDWPEGDKDFEVFLVKEGESEDSAIERAQEVYDDMVRFYVTEVE